MDNAPERAHGAPVFDDGDVRHVRNWFLIVWDWIWHEITNMIYPYPLILCMARFGMLAMPVCWHAIHALSHAMSLQGILLFILLCLV